MTNGVLIHCPECNESWQYLSATFDSYEQELWELDRLILQHLLDNESCRVLLDRLADSSS